MTANYPILLNRFNKRNSVDVNIEEDLNNQHVSQTFNENDLSNLDLDIDETKQPLADDLSEEDEFDFAGKIFHPGINCYGIFLPSFSEKLQDEKLEIAYKRYAQRQRQMSIMLVNFADILFKVGVSICAVVGVPGETNDQGL